VHDLVDAYIFDCDGVLWRDSHLIEGALEALRALRTLGKRVFFVSNNSTKSRETYLKRLTAFGFEASTVGSLLERTQDLTHTHTHTQDHIHTRTQTPETPHTFIFIWIITYTHTH
jgi:ribonucleotide monophosphatase NagD (HAD superfamily)